MTDTDTDTLFVESAETEPPTPVQSSRVVAHNAFDKDAIPEQFYVDEHMAEVGDMTVLRSAFECQRCGGNVYLHPESIIPHNCVYCWNCKWSPSSIVWWEDTTLADYAGGEDP